MSSKTTTIVTCDVCDYEIDPNVKYIDAGSYGIHMHKTCAINLDFYSTIKILGLDEIKLMYIDGWQESEKIVHFKSKELI